jgi:hypothetical protein
MHRPPFRRLDAFHPVDDGHLEVDPDIAQETPPTPSAARVAGGLSVSAYWFL